jgi:hypothetical protein
MADLTFSQGADPVSLYNDISGNQLAISSAGAASVAGAVADGVTASPNPVVIGGVDTAGVVRLLTTIDTFAVESLCVINVPVLSYLTGQNKVYSVALSVAAASAGVDNPLVYIRNPSGSGKALHILKVIGGTAVANVADTYKLTANPTVSANGTSQTAVSRNVGGGAGTAVALVTTLPTVSAVGSVLQNAVGGQNSQTVEILIEEYSTIVQPNNAILVTADPSSNNRVSAITVIWAEI